MTIRLKALRKQEERIKKVKDMMENMYSIRVPSIPTYNYQPIGAGSVIDANPTIAKTKGLFQMFHIER